MITREAPDRFDPGLAVSADPHALGFEFGQGTFGPPQPELRRLDDIRRSLRDPDCAGPDPLYAIAMDVGRVEHEEELKRRMLLFGVVLYSSGRLGQEPVRSQGHVHAIAPHCGWSTPELIEVWQGTAVVYLQQHAADDPGTCIAVSASAGDYVVIPPGWAHCVINADVRSRMLFGAFCDRQYAFEYDEVRARNGLAWFPLVAEEGSLAWQPNPRYRNRRLEFHAARQYPELGLLKGVPLYEQFARSPERLQWVSDPARVTDLWTQFTP